MPVKHKKPEKFKKKRSAPVKRKVVAKKPVVKKKNEVVVQPPTVVTEVNPSEVPLPVSSGVVTEPLVMAASPSSESQAETVSQQTVNPTEVVSESPAAASAPPTQESVVSPTTQTPAVSTIESVAVVPPASAVPIQGEENILVNTSEEKSSKRLFMLVAILVLLLIAAGGEVHLLLQLKQRQENTAQNSVVSVHKPTATPTPTVNITKYTITVLNGSGISGEAAKVKDMLMKDGFSVSDVGNATNSAFTKTVIQAKTDVNATVTKKLKDTLAVSYQVAASISALPAADTGDIVVIVGSTKQESQ